MIIFRKPTDISNFLSLKKSAQVTAGFVPTMGALHGGHISLVTTARNENQLVICSIFVNPTQFNDPNDFKQYPATIEKDIRLLEKSGCDVLFIPSVPDIYPDGFKTNPRFELGPIEYILEGEFRPGHFQGVCQVVNRLLDIIMPHKLYIGQKDFQQCMVLQKLIELTGIHTKIIICPTLREPDGLAMSSRNLRLTEVERKIAPVIYLSLLSIKKEIKAGNIRQLKENSKRVLAEKGFKVDYLEIVNPATLETEQDWDGKARLVVLVAAWLNDVRLIDNIIINELPPFK